MVCISSVTIFVYQYNVFKLLIIGQVTDKQCIFITSVIMIHGYFVLMLQELSSTTKSFLTFQSSVIITLSVLLTASK